MSGGITANTLSSMSSKTLRRRSEGRVWMKVTGSMGVSELAFWASSRRCCSALCCASTYGTEVVNGGIPPTQAAWPHHLPAHILPPEWLEAGQPGTQGSLQSHQDSPPLQELSYLWRGHFGLVDGCPTGSGGLPDGCHQVEQPEKRGPHLQED